MANIIYRLDGPVKPVDEDYEEGALIVYGDTDNPDDRKTVQVDYNHSADVCDATGLFSRIETVIAADFGLCPES